MKRLGDSRESLGYDEAIAAHRPTSAELEHERAGRTGRAWKKALFWVFRVGYTTQSTTRSPLCVSSARDVFSS